MYRDPWGVIAPPTAQWRNSTRLMVRALLSGVGVLVLVGLVGAPPALARQVIRSADPPGGATSSAPPASDGTAQPLTAADRDLVIRVRLAGLWEMPAGQMAAKKGTLPRVREIGAMISAQHSQLDAVVVKAAAELGVTLPDRPNPDQQQWLQEMSAASGHQFDEVFVSRLRAAHGKIFPAIGAVRSGTRNDVVRKLAQTANGFVLMHLTLLESTGLVDYSVLPLPPDPTPAIPSPASAAAGSGSPAAGLLAAVRAHSTVLLLVLVAGVAGLLWFVVRRRVMSLRGDGYGVGRERPRDDRSDRFDRIDRIDRIDRPGRRDRGPRDEPEGRSGRQGRPSPYAQQGFADQPYESYVDQPYESYADQGFGDRAYAGRSYADRAYADRSYSDRSNPDRAYADRANPDRSYVAYEPAGARLAPAPHTPRTNRLRAIPPPRP